MIFCTGCGKQIHETAPACPHCGKPQQAVGGLHREKSDAKAGGTWAGVASLVLGIVCVLAMFDDSSWDSDTVAGLAMFSVIGLVLGVMAFKISQKGRGVAIAGIVMASIGLLSAIGQS